MLMFAAMTNHAGFEVTGQKLHAEGIERRTCGSDLVEDFDTITVFVDHLSDSVDLAVDSVNAGADFFAGVGFHNELNIPPRVYSIHALEVG